MRTWQVERRKRTRHLIELGGLVVKAGIVDLTSDDRTVIVGALLWMADKLQSDEREKALALWAAKGKLAFEAVRASSNLTAAQDQPRGACSRRAARRPHISQRRPPSRDNAAPLFLVVDMGEMASILPWQKRQSKLLQESVVPRSCILDLLLDLN